MQWGLEATLEWGEENAIAFDPDKAELIHFYHTGNQLHEESVACEDTEIKPSPSIRWLGVYLDLRLTFRTHVETLAGKALRVANFPKSLNKTQKGPPPKAVAIAAKAFVLPVALYSMEAWWPGHERQSNNDPNKQVTTGVGEPSRQARQGPESRGSGSPPNVENHQH